MKLNMRTRAAGIAVACAAIVLPVSAVATSAASGASAAAPKCTATIPWIGVGADGGFAGGHGYVLEFSNTGKSACTIKGHPIVKALEHGKQVGHAARSEPGAGSTITLAPGATAHAQLLVFDAANFCGRHTVPSSELLVIPPGGAGNGGGLIDFSVGSMCRGKSTMAVGPIMRGTGIPN